MSRTSRPPTHRHALFSLLILPCLAAAAEPSAGGAATPAAAQPPSCQVEPAVERQLNDTEAALHRIFMGTGDERAKVHAAVDGAQAVLVFPNVAKVGFFVTAAQGKGLLSYREADGNWSHPIVVSVRASSVGPHFSMQTIDTMIVAKTHEALIHLLTGTAPAQTAAGQAVAAEIVTYSGARGLTAGITIDNYKITIDQEANQGLYCQPILAEDLIKQGHKMTVKPPPCAQKFAQTMNRVAGRAPIIRQY
jgi:lipid-binding SYLF domain-containing protein